jgi:hypothetical protein
MTTTQLIAALQALPPQCRIHVDPLNPALSIIHDVQRGVIYLSSHETTMPEPKTCAPLDHRV